MYRNCASYGTAYIFSKVYKKITLCASDVRCESMARGELQQLVKLTESLQHFLVSCLNLILCLAFWDLWFRSG